MNITRRDRGYGIAIAAIEAATAELEADNARLRAELASTRPERELVQVRLRDLRGAA